MRLTAKLAILFLLLSVIPIIIVGYLSYRSGRDTIEKEMINHLLSTNILKKAELDRWVHDNAQLLEILAKSPYFRNEFAAEMAAHDPADPAHLATHERVISDHLTPLIEGGGFFELFILRAGDGLVLISTDEKQEGKQQKDRAFFVQGKIRTFVQNVYYSMTLQQAAMTISTPLRDKRGSLIAVLAGRVDLGDLSKIMEQRSGLKETENTYLVNKFNFFVTEPRFGKDYALKKSVHTKGVEAALTHQDGVGFYADYRNKPVIGAYHWMPERELGIITEIDQAEAFAPIYALQRTTGAFGVAAALLAALLGWLSARTITRPAHRLVKAAQEIGRGNLDYKVSAAGRDEIGELSRAFGQMTEKLRETLVSRDELAKEVAERKRAEDRIKHLNRVLLAIREVNQLIVREKDPARLIQETCRLLVAHRGYSSALIILTGNEGTPPTYAEAGLAEETFPTLAESLQLGVLPPCCDRVRRSEGIFHVTDHVSFCAGCPIEAGYVESDTLCIRLEHVEKTHGYLAVSLGHGMGLDTEERSLFSELAGDVAFALHNIEQGTAVQQAQKEREDIENELRQSQKMEAIGRLAGGVAHDFNNMLNVILGYAEMAQSRLDSQDPLHQDLREIEQAARRSSDLVRQLLAFSRKQLMEPKIVNLNQAVAEHKRMLGRMIGEDIEIHSVPADDLWSIRIDPSQLAQILTNLLVNARDAIPGVGTITIETANVVLDETYSRKHLYVRPGQYVMLAVSDTGMGMSADTLERIFEPFFTSKEPGKGTGLGLSTVYGIVKQNEGVILAYSEPGRGTTFKIYFPRFEGKTVETPKEVKVVSLTGSETVLIVEDEAQILKLAKVILERHGYRVLTAMAPGEALLLVEKNPGDIIHLLLTDVVMPGMSGKELRKRIEGLKPGVKTLFMSGYTANAIAQRGVLEESVHFIQKPFSVKGLAEKVRRVLDA